LPDLAGNVKCGNSLIGSDYWDFARGKTVGLSPLSERSFEITDEERRRVNPFDWEVEFAEIMKGGGFDAVIGNPPYVRAGSLIKHTEYLVRTFDTFSTTADLYVCFIEKALNLARSGGRFGYIVSNKWMRAGYGKRLRKLVKKFQIEKLIDFGELKVFQDASTFPLILIISKDDRKRKPWYAPIKRLDFGELTEEVNTIYYELEEAAMADGGFRLIRPEVVGFIEKIKGIGLPLGEYVKGKLYRGILTGFNKAFVIGRDTRDNLVNSDPKSRELIKPFIVGDDVRKFRINFRERYLIVTEIGVPIKEYPAVFEYLKKYKSDLEKRWDKGKHWWELRACGYYSEFKKPKIVWPEIAKESRFAWDDNSYYCNKTCFIIPSEDFYLLGILNSRLVWEFLLTTCPVLGDPDKRGRLTQQAVYVEQIPIRNINFSDRADRARHDKMVALVEEMLALHKRLAAAKADADKQRLERAIKATDRKIDTLVYELYGLTDEEIRIVES